MIDNTCYCIANLAQNAQAYPCDSDKDACRQPVALEQDCITTPGVATASPTEVTVKGVVDPFGLKKDTNDKVFIQFFKADGTAIGAEVETSMDGSRKEDEYFLGGFTYPNLPVNTMMYAKIVNRPAAGLPEFKETYVYNQYYRNDRCLPGNTDSDTCYKDGTSGKWIYKNDLTIIRNETWALIPLTAGLSTGIQPGNGAIAGRVYDCNLEEHQVMFAVVGLSKRASKTVYFNDDYADPNADISRTSTNRNGLFAMLDIPSGPIKVAAQIMVGGVVKTLNIMDAHVYPDSVTLLNIYGPYPTLP